VLGTPLHPSRAGFSRRQSCSPCGLRTGPIWQKRFYDFNVCTTEKRIEKLR
jgi:hypothetical protein